MIISYREDKMSKRLLITFILIISIISINVFGFSQEDPVVSLSYLKSYVEKVKIELIKEFDLKILNLQKNLSSESIKSQGNKEEIISGNNQNIDLVGQKYEIYHIKEGARLIFDKNVEFILRSGKAKVIDGTLDGIVDLTDGKGVYNSSDVLLNHLFLVPRKDSRGIVAETNIWIMVKGDFDLYGEEIK